MISDEQTVDDFDYEKQHFLEIIQDVEVFVCINGKLNPDDQ